MYLIPKNVGGKFELFEGFGIKELIYCAVGAVVGVGITLLLTSFTDSNFAKVLPIPGITAIVFFCVRSDPRLGQSILSNLKDQRRFLSKPRTYFYVFGKGRNLK